MRIPIDLHEMSHGVIVDRVMNGYIVTIGCQRAVFTNYNDVLTALEEYGKDPLRTELKWARAAREDDDGTGPELRERGGDEDKPECVRELDELLKKEGITPVDPEGGPA